MTAVYMQPQSPCLGCGERSYNCWSACDRYKAYKKELDEFKAQEKHIKNKEKVYADYVFRKKG